MRKIYTLLLLLSLTFLNAQNLTFTDPAFKNLLVNTNCVIAEGENTPSSSVDINNDGEIQQDEADAVVSLIVNSSEITSIEGIENFTNMEWLDCINTQVTEVDLSGNTSLISLYIRSNPQLISLNITALNNLYTFYCNNNDLITEIDASQCSAKECDFSSNPSLTYINLRNGVYNECIFLLLEGMDYTCSMFLDLPSLQIVCMDDDESFTSNAPQAEVEFLTNCNMGINDNNLNLFTIYPNPVQNNLTIQSETNTIKEIFIYNMIGQKIQSIKSNNMQNINVDVSLLQSGTYIIEIITNGGTMKNKFIKL